MKPSLAISSLNFSCVIKKYSLPFISPFLGGRVVQDTLNLNKEGNFFNR